MSIKKYFGTTKNGDRIYEYTIKNSNNMKAVILNYGCVIKEIWVPDRWKRLRDVVLGFDDIEGYERDHSSLGACIGRHANRLEHGLLIIDDNVYQLTCNSNGHHLHGGEKGFSKCVWECEDSENSVTLHRISPDGEEGYPGNLDVCVTYTISKKNELIIDYRAKSDKDTIVNLSNHSYFNLDGVDIESVKNQDNRITILDHKVLINAERYTEIDSESVQTGRFIDVKGTVYDFSKQKRIGDNIEKNDELLRQTHGYDINYEILGEDFKCAATMCSDVSGINLECSTSQPGVQFYTGNYLNKSNCKYGFDYKMNAAVCLETQNYPNSIIRKNFPSAILRKGELYESRTVYAFGRDEIL